MSEYIDVAALGWEHPQWHGEFYPADLPPEWRLTYYANEFSSVVVPAAKWWDAAEEEVNAWQDAVSDSFRFYWELPSLDTMTIERWYRVTALLHPWSGGLVISGKAEASESGELELLMLPAGFKPATGAALQGTLAIARCPEQPRRIRDLLEWMTASSCVEALMLCDNIARLRQASLVAKMLGVSRSR
jgi:hypothetical protein